MREKDQKKNEDIFPDKVYKNISILFGSLVSQVYLASTKCRRKYVYVYMDSL